MSKKIDPRSATKKEKDAAYAKFEPALIVKPLKFIRANCQNVWGNMEDYEFARRRAAKGDGGYVRACAEGMAYWKQRRAL